MKRNTRLRVHYLGHPEVTTTVRVLSRPTRGELNVEGVLGGRFRLLRTPEGYWMPPLNMSGPLTLLRLEVIQ